MFARFDENPAMTLQDIKETKRYGRTDRRTHGQRENSIPTTNKVCGGGYNYLVISDVKRIHHECEGALGRSILRIKFGTRYLPIDDKRL